MNILLGEHMFLFYKILLLLLLLLWVGLKLVLVLGLEILGFLNICIGDYYF